MTTEIVLTSPSTHLRIVLETENCSFSHSTDGSIFNVEAMEKNFISRSDLTLTNASSEQIWSTSLSRSGKLNNERIRVDSIFPLVFKENEIFQVFPSLILSFCTCESSARNVFELRINLILTSDKAAVSRPTLTDIYSETLLVEDTSIPVSKELLLSSSPFFERIFNENFSEKGSGVYEIKEIPVDDFRWFIKSFHKRRWEFSSIDRALLALSYADRFELLYLHSRVLPYLKKKRLPENTVKDTLILCSKFNRIDRLIEWVLAHCENDNKAQQMLYECAPEMTTHAVQASFKAFHAISLREKDKVVQRIMSNLRSGLAANKLIVYCRCYDNEGTVEFENAFVLTSHDTEFYWQELFKEIPEQYTVAKCGDKVLLRTQLSGFWGYEYQRVVEVHAYRE